MSFRGPSVGVSGLKTYIRVRKGTELQNLFKQSVPNIIDANQTKYLVHQNDKIY